MHQILIFNIKLIYFLTVIVSQLGAEGRLAMRFLGLFCYLGVRSVCNGSWSGHSAFRNLHPAPCF